MASDELAPLRKLVHDLRSPLAVVEGFATFLARDEGKLTEEQRRDFAQRVASGAADMRKLLDDAAP
ncbi:MAG TPA: histidine kinase dimerization/phospho-acceptor domain-containing protein [Solirubrobacteraceae bacterium]